jgi:hypothetical protein
MDASKHDVDCVEDEDKDKDPEKRHMLGVNKG